MKVGWQYRNGNKGPDATALLISKVHESPAVPWKDPDFFLIICHGPDHASDGASTCFPLVPIPHTCAFSQEVVGITENRIIFGEELFADSPDTHTHTHTHTHFH